MTVDLLEYERKFKLCDRELLASITLALLKIAVDHVKSNNGAMHKLGIALSPLDKISGCDVSAKKKALPKKKPPAGGPNCVTRSAAKATRYPIFWNPTSGEPPSTDSVCVEMIPRDCREAAKFFAIDPAQGHALQLVAKSIFSVGLTPGASELVAKATEDENVDKYFLKLKAEKAQMVAELNARVLRRTARPSFVPHAYAQRFGVVIHGFRKICGPSMEAAYNAILKCTICETDAGLMADTLCNVDEAPDLQVALEGIEAALKEHPVEWLYDDERFLLMVVSRIPQLKERMKCLKRALELKQLAIDLTTKLKALEDAARMISVNSNIHYFHKLLLAVGNKLNEGNALRSKQLYFKFSAFIKALDVRGNLGLNLTQYLMNFLPESPDVQLPGTQDASGIGNANGKGNGNGNGNSNSDANTNANARPRYVALVSDEDFKTLGKAAQMGVGFTFGSAAAALNDYMFLARSVGSPSDPGASSSSKRALSLSGKLASSGVPPPPFAAATGVGPPAAKGMVTKVPKPLGDEDELTRCLQGLVEAALPAMKDLASAFYRFCWVYTQASFFFGDPNTLLPLDKAKGEPDGDDRDLIQRYLWLLNTYQGRVTKPVFAHSITYELLSPKHPGLESPLHPRNPRASLPGTPPGARGFRRASLAKQAAVSLTPSGAAFGCSQLPTRRPSVIIDSPGPGKRSQPDNDENDENAFPPKRPRDNILPRLPAPGRRPLIRSRLFKTTK